MTEHKKRIIRVLNKQLDRTDSKRATGGAREEIKQLIEQLTTKQDDSTRAVQGAVS